MLFLVDEKYGVRILNIEDIRNIIKIDDIKISEKRENPSIQGVFVYLSGIEITDIIANANRQKIMILSKKGLNIYDYTSPEYIKFINNIQINNQLGSIRYFNNKFYIPAFSNMVLELYEYNLKDNNPLLKNYFLKTFSENFNLSRNYNDFIIDTNNHRSFIVTEKSIDVVKFNPTPKITENIITNEFSAEKILSVKYENKKIYALQLKHFKDNGEKNYLRVFEENAGHFNEIICKQISDSAADAFAIKDNTFFIENDRGLTINREPIANLNPLYETTLDKNSETPDKDMIIFEHYLISIIDGLKIYDIDDNFKLIASNKDLNGMKMFIKDKLIYIVDKNGFTIASIHDILNIEILSKYNYKPRFAGEKGYPISIFADDKFAYLTIGEKNSNKEEKNNYYLLIIDISDPKNPAFSGGYKTKGNLVDIQIKNDIAYIAEKGHVSGLEMIDISDKQYPLRIGEYGKDIKGYPCEGLKIVLKNDFAFIAFSKAIHVLNVKDSSNPKLIKEIGIKQNFNDFDINGDYLYIYSTGSGFTIMNIKDNANPYIIDTFPSFYYADRIKVSDKYIFMFDSGKGILVFKNPIKIQFFDSLESDTIQLKFPRGLSKGKYKLKYFSDKGQEEVYNIVTVE
ncbi:hypothetical protein HY745_14875 [Candidatus Desantisbacteria bacterium]|nr:hypothetical protein [Candidatus Desantisbacteria bacterium]